MANTVIALKKSATPSAVPSSLANGELAINYADGKLYYKAPNNAILSISGGGSSNSFSTINANNTLVVSDSPTDILTIEPGKNITVVGDAVNDKITIGLTDDLTISGTLHVKAQGGLEGGQIELANAVSGSTLAGNVVIDIYGDRLRFYEKNSPNKGAFIDLSIAGSGVSSNLLATSAGTTDTVARATADAAFAKANGALANTDGVTFGGTLLVSKNLSADRIISTNNGNGENYKVGDDAWIGDTNLADTVRIKGQQNPENAYISLGNNDGKLLGRAGAGPLTWDGNTIWTAGNDGSGSGLDADLLDGQDSSYFGTAIAVSAAYDKANSANLLAYNTGTGANAFTSATITGANAAVGAGANSYAATVGSSANSYAATVGTSANTYLLSVIAGANTAVGAGANAYADIVGTSANTYLLTVIAGANAAVGAGANTVGSAAFEKANSAATIASAAYDKSNANFSSSGGIINGSVSISGNLTVSGNTSYISVENYRVDDPLIYLAGNNYISDIVDIGFIANYVNATGSNVHTGIFRDAGTKEYYVFEGYDEEPRNNVIDPNGNNFTISVLNAKIKSSNITLAGQNVEIWINAAYGKANDANLLAYNTGIGANAFTSSTTDGANTAVGAGANTYANLVWSRSNTYSDMVGISANAFASATIAGANVITFAAYDQANVSQNIAISAFIVANAANSKSGSGGATISETPPGSPTAGSFWWNSNTGKLLIYYTDSDTSQWVEATSAGGITVTSGSGSTNITPAFTQANIAYSQANAAFDQANLVFNQANAAFDNANSTLAVAIAAFEKANSIGTAVAASLIFGG